MTSTGSGGDVLWPLADHLGTIRDIGDLDEGTNSFGIANHRVYDSFGNLISQTNSSASIDFAYTGKYFDPDTGLSYHWNRWFDPGLGKWLTPDPIGFAAGDANLYRYVGNHPTGAIDPSGLQERGVEMRVQAQMRRVRETSREATPEEKEEFELGIQLGTVAFDIAGIVDPTPVCDGFGAAGCFLTGDYQGVMLSTAGMIPYIGDPAKVGKLPKIIRIVDRAIELSGKSERFARRARPVLESVYRSVSQILDTPTIRKAIPESGIEHLRVLRTKLEKVVAPVRVADLPWGRVGARQAAKAIEAGQTSITVASRDDAAEVVWRMFSSRGFTNTTGRTGSDVRKLLGSKAGTYHWDDALDAAGNVAGHGADNVHGAMRHVQIHLESGEIIRIFFP